MHDENIQMVIDNLRRKSLRSRLEGLVYVFIILVVCGLIMFSFIKFSGDIISIQTGEGTIIENLTVSQNEKHSTDFYDVIGGVVLKFGAVMLAIFLIQILVGFARYRFKISEIHSSNADALLLSQNDVDKLSSISTLLSPNIDFSKIPSAPYDKALNIIKDVVSKSKG